MFDDFNLALDDPVIINAVDPSCLSPASKRDVFDELSLLGKLLSNTDPSSFV